jgi:hypothetical protein
MTSQLQQLSQKVHDAIDAMEVLAEKEFIQRLQVLSMRFPDRLLEAVGGMGVLYVNIYARHQRQYNCWGFGGKSFYQLNESGDLDGPELLRSAQDYMFQQIIKVQDDHNFYRFYPMVACGHIKFKNGKITSDEN